MIQFDWPIGTPAERLAYDRLPGAWIVACRHGQRYDATGKWAVHTGFDFNLNSPTFDADAHAPVYAAADGVVRFAGHLPVWGTVITIEHTGLNQRPLWTRYAHVEEMTIKQGDLILRGEPIARVGNADGRYPYHLHYDVAVVDLGQHPGDWPGDDVARVQRDYLDPLTFMVQQSGDQNALPVSVQVFAQPYLNIRSAPNATSKVIGWLPQKSIVVVVEKTHDNWGRILQDAKARAIDGWIALWWTKGI